MNKPVFELLDVSINGVNRFISSSVPCDRAMTSYQEQSFPVQFATSSEVLAVAEDLVAAVMSTVPSPRANTVEETIDGLCQIFSSPAVLLGDREICDSTVEALKPTIRHLYARQQPLAFTLLGYPHKMPNPLYSVSTGADLGEVFSLMKLSRIMERVGSVYPFGVKLHVLTENTIFHRMSDISDQEQHRYFLDLCRWAKHVDPNGFIQIEDIVAHHTPELEIEWEKVTKELRSGYTSGDRIIVDMVESVMPTNFMTLNYRSFPNEILTRFFDPNCHEECIEQARRERYERALEESFSYLAYHQARYRLAFMDKAFPDSPRLTVAPKAGSFGVKMLNAAATLLPYYGYILKKGSNFSFHYITDIPRSATAVYDVSCLAYPMYFES